MYSLIKPLLFRLDSETAHDLTLQALKWMPGAFFPTPSEKPVHLWGLEFKHPVGLAAGFDKNGAYINALSRLGFSFIEIGTVTPKPQPGNPRPRLFRLPDADAVINRFGFNNLGVDALVANVAKANYAGILGINIGKNKDTPLNLAHEDYLHCLRKVYPYASYITVNISSPNTPKLRELQQGDFLSFLLKQLNEERQRLSDTYQRYVPMVIKLSPDESDDNIKLMGEMIVTQKMDGIIATNTTCSRQSVQGLKHGAESGGLSGAPLHKRSTQCIALLRQVVGPEMGLIAAGGIMDASAALEKWHAGANLLQIYTGLIYQGPGLIKTVVECLPYNTKNIQ